jgi:hypothetical protein
MSARSELRAVAAAFLCSLLVGCSETWQARELRPHGFLSDYARLAPGPEGGAQLRYRSATADFEHYEAILLDPVEVWRSPETKGLSKEDRKRLADRLYSLIYSRLARDFRMVHWPGRGALRISVALTGAQPSKATLDAISTVIPQALLVNQIQEMATGKAAFVGEASLEARIRDSGNGEVLMEGIDRRVGRKSLSGVMDSWSDVDQSLVHWADRLALVLCWERNRSSCSEY